MQAFKPLTFAQVKANKSTLDTLTGKDVDVMDRLLAAETLLKAAEPGLDLETETPGAILKAASDLYTSTFARPEDAAPAHQNP